MASVSGLKYLAAVAAAIMAVLLAVSGCASLVDRGQVTPERVQLSATPTDTWAGVQQKTPYPYTLPLPKPTRTMLDGTYTKYEIKDTPPVHCLRCPDYAPEGGIWKLQFDRGVFRVLHEATGWNSLGSFVLSKDRRTAGTTDQVVLFNDPNCPEYVGTYAWRLEEGKLFLEAIEDSCSIHLRAKNLTNLPWLSCQPPTLEPGITDHWQEPPGCD